MTTQTVSFPLGLVELTAAIYLWRCHRIHRIFPAFFACLCLECLAHFAACYDYQIATRMLQPWRLMLRFLLVVEVGRCSYHKLRPSVQLSAAAICLAITTAVMYAARANLALTYTRGIFAFRQAALLSICLSAWWLVAGAHLKHGRVDRLRSAHRLGSAVWLTVPTICGTFVHGGLGCVIFGSPAGKCSQAVWNVVNILAYFALGAVVVGMTAAFARSPKLWVVAAPARPRRIVRTRAVARRVA